ncbi:MAG TPA: hypothetical protein VHC63_15265 [Acidimicrobiales bacterium]|nr:hypothetical protein [Acidimicrobiales bacterium]
MTHVDVHDTIDALAASIDLGEAAAGGWPTLGDAALHGIFGDIVRTLEPHTEADRAALLVDALVEFGNAVGAGPHAVADGAKHPARLYAVTVGATSRGRKGTAHRQISRLFAEADQVWSKTRVMGGLSTGEGLIAAVRDPMSEDDKSAPTDKRLLAVEPEFARTLTAAARDGNTVSAVLRDAFDTGDIGVMTKKDPMHAAGAHISVLAHITVEELRRKLSDTEVANGFANRFLVILARRSKLLPEGGALPPAEFDRLVRLVRRALGEARKIGTLTRDDDAKALWASIYTDLAEQVDDGLVGAITARAEALLLRLSVIYAIADGTNQITTTHVRAAHAVWSYAEASARFIWGDVTGDPIADTLMTAVTKAGPAGLTGKEQSALFSGHKDAKTLDRTRSRLITEGKVIAVSSPTRGRPIDVIFAPAYAEQANKAKQGEWRQ